MDLRESTNKFVRLSAAGLPSCKAEATPLSSTITLDVSLILQTDSISTLVTLWGLGQHIVAIDKIRGVDTCILMPRLDLRSALDHSVIQINRLSTTAYHHSFPYLFASILLPLLHCRSFTLDIITSPSNRSSPWHP
jgi:hypothetical protein